MSYSSSKCFENLSKHSPAFIDDFKIPKRAAVLIPLLIDSNDKLNVLLTLRSKYLRTHAGEVAFPGGKQDPEDVDLIDTALREAQEEIGLERSQVQVIKVLSPALSKNNILVTPVVGLISANFEPIINEAEVSSVFTVPLDRFMISEGHQFIDINWMLKPFRSHRFDWAGYSIWVTLILIQGFTSSVCVRVAMIAYDREPEFQFLADGQPNHKEIIKQVEWSLLELEKPNL